MARDSGQGTVEWLGLVLALAGVIFTGGALSQAPFVARTIDRQMQRAYCVMRHGDCQRDREPCVVAASERNTGWTVRLFVAELGRGKVAVLEHLSDGSVKVTETTHGAIASKMKIGVGGSAGGGIKLGADLSGTLSASADGARSWLAPNAAQAAEIVRRLKAGEQVSDPDISYNRLGMSRDARVNTVAQRGKVKLAAGGGLGVQRTAGIERNARTGNEILHFLSGAERSGKVTVLGKTPLEKSSKVAADEQYAIERDAGGRLLDLRVTTTSSRLPELALPFGGMIDAEKSAKPRTYELTAHLDLTEPASRSAATKLVDALRNPSPERLRDAAGRVRALVQEKGVISVRAYEQEADEHDLSLKVKVIKGVEAGVKRSESERSTTLVAAGSRDAAGNWLPRDDCVARAVSGA